MLLYEKESYRIRHAAFEVYKKLGCGHKESVYQKSFYVSLSKESFNIEQERRLPVSFDGKNVGNYVPDFVINEKIIVELKAKPYIIQEDIKQFWQYLKVSDKI